LFTVFCSTDLVREIRHPIHTVVDSPIGTQTLINVFDWSVLKNDTADSHANLTKVILRVYKDSNTTDDCSKATLQTKVYCKHNTGEMEITGRKMDVDMSNGRNWEELDLTETFKSLWPIPDGGYEVYVTVILKSTCEDSSLPIKLLDLKSIKKLRSRRKIYDEQPVMCMYISNEAVEGLARKAPKPMPAVPNDETFKIPLDDYSDRRKRNTGVKSDKCRRVDHIVSFVELNMSYVIAPTQFNAGKCVGYCDKFHLHDMTFRGELQKSNNYARLLAAQAHIRNEINLTICCSPGEYEPVMLLVQTVDGSSVKQKMYHEMRVRDCYCR